MKIEYVDRKTGQKEVEEIYGRWALALLYGESVLSQIFSFLFLPFIARIPWASKWYGFLQKSPSSARKVLPFIAAYNIDASEFQEQTFESFNDFFIRKLKPETRPIAKGKDRAVLPADGRYLVFPDLSRTDRFYVKGQTFDLPSFLQDPLLAHRFGDGSMAIARLCPTDYHRFHFPCDGMAGRAKPIEGPLFSVNPVALRRKLSILAENKRVVTEIKTDHFGTMLYVEVGATCVGSIHQTYRQGRILKGDEKGYFSFGGSCLVLLFEKGKIHFDEDLVSNTKNGLETKGLFGTSFGKGM